MTEVCKLPWCSLHKIHIRRVSNISRSFRSIISKIPAELRGRPGALCGSRGEAGLAAGASLNPYLNEESEIGVYCPGPFSPPLFFFSRTFLRVLITVFDSSKFCNKLDAPEGCIRHSTFHPPCTELGLCIHLFEMCLVI